MRDECRHGSLRRKCEPCALESELREAREALRFVVSRKGGSFGALAECVEVAERALAGTPVLADALDTARREGAEAMREAAAAHVETAFGTGWIAKADAARAIRALPLPGDDRG